MCVFKYVVGIASKLNGGLNWVRILMLIAIVPGIQTARAATKQQIASPNSEHKLLVGYFPQWGLYYEHPYTVKELVQSGAAGMLDQLNYAQGFVTNGRCSVADPNADMNYTFTEQTSVDGKADPPQARFRGNFHQLQELKRKYPKLKIVISLEGRGSDFAADAQPAARAAFVASCVNVFLKGHFGPNTVVPGLFDGIDIDWEYPSGADAKNYLPLVQEFRRQMDAYRHGLILSVALGTDPHAYGDADLAEVGKIVDVAGLMTYDFSGPWDKTTGFVAPLSSDTPNQGSVVQSVSAWEDAGIPANKLLVGLPFYGYSWHDVPNVDHGLGQDGRPIHGDHPYREIQSIISADPKDPSPSQGMGAPEHPLRVTGQDIGSPAASSAVVATGQPKGDVVVYRDPQSNAPWLFDGNSFWTYDDPTSIRAKASFVDSQQLGGFMVWELSEDTRDAVLLKTARHSLSAFSWAAAQSDDNPEPMVGGAE